MEISYRTNAPLEIDEIIEVYVSSGINRPINDTGRIAKMYRNANLVITAWDNGKLVGISRSLTDFCYCCYLSDLAVRKDYQKLGIGRELVRHTKEVAGDQSTLILVSAPAAVAYYPKIGLDTLSNGFIIKRTN